LKGYFIVMIKFKMSLHAFVDRVSATSWNNALTSRRADPNDSFYLKFII
jgi:hypothetical protein